MTLPKPSAEMVAFYEHRTKEHIAAVEHHMSVNRHHPDCHADPNDMSGVDLIEMVCDWTAMSLEFDQDGGSARAWADKTLGHRVPFNEEQRRFIYEMIALLDSKITKRDCCR